MTNSSVGGVAAWQVERAIMRSRGSRSIGERTAR